MSRMKSVSAVAVLALALFAASLAYAQEGSTPSSAPAKAPTHSTKVHATAKHTMPKVDLNSATKEELMKLPGIGEATADKIIEARPFKTKSELVSKGLLTKAAYEKVSARLIAKQETKQEAKQ